MANLYERSATELNAIVPEIWSRNWFPTLLAKLPFNSLVARDYEGDIKALGDQVNISSFTEFAAAAELAEDAANDSDSLTVATQALVINKMTVKDFIITTRAIAQSLEATDKLQEMAMYAIMKRMESVIIAAIVPSVAPDHTISYTTPGVLALADIQAAKVLLDAQNVPDADRKLIVGSTQYNQLFSITGFTSRDFVPAGSPLSAGAIKTPVLGFDVDWTTMAGAVSYFFHPSFMNVAVQKDMEVKSFDLGVNGIRGQRYNLSVLWGLKQTSDVRVVTVS